MARQRRADTAAELGLRRVLFGIRRGYRIHYKVPGMPRRTIDVAYVAQRVAVFVDGCFWHGCPKHAVAPRKNADWWADKLAGNRTRVKSTTAHLESRGWVVLRYWEHDDPIVAAQEIVEAVRASSESSAH
ncbi:very short patch repair endonuclease [Flexivirga endophytica]|nr:very short patch repair endonuclease [Flexivirga endophytica]